jgi:hypothetical protein
VFVLCMTSVCSVGGLHAQCVVNRMDIAPARIGIAGGWTTLSLAHVFYLFLILF